MKAKSSPKMRRAVLGHVLYEHPAELTPDALRREFGDEARQAIVDLLAAGLLRQEGGHVRPSRAALSFYRLDLP
ncbi:MAG TPA: hypothetical protein VNS60_05180 [Solirubrobacterales bacterium]|nr:hypothetical protein [Solirubrobacterales bacterium]